MVSRRAVIRRRGTHDVLPRRRRLWQHIANLARNPPSMTNAAETPADGMAAPPAWRDLILDGRSVYSTLVFLGTALHALRILVIAIIIPTVVADIGGAEVSTWAALPYTVGAIVGTASLGPVWRRRGRQAVGPGRARRCDRRGIRSAARSPWSTAPTWCRWRSRSSSCSGWCGSARRRTGINRPRDPVARAAAHRSTRASPSTLLRADASRRG